MNAPDILIATHALVEALEGLGIGYFGPRRYSYLPFSNVLLRTPGFLLGFPMSSLAKSTVGKRYNQAQHQTGCAGW